MHVGAISIELYLPGCNSLKDKRSRLKPLLARLHKQFNVSAAEIEANDSHRTAIVACVVVSNNRQHVQQVLGSIPRWIEMNRPDLQLVDDQITLL